MKPLDIKEIIEATNGTLLQSNGEEAILRVCIDSRIAKDGDIFIPIKGESHDGHDYILKAYECGAKTFIKDKNHELSLKGVNIIEVEDTTIALGDIARLYKSKFKIPFVSITGSTGKTTTKDILHCVLSSRYNTLKTEGNYNNHIGLPLTIFNLSKDNEAAILEMGMSSKGEIEYLANIVHPHIAVISNIGLSHIENLGSQLGILEAKLEICSNFKENNVLIVNGDDEHLKCLKNKGFAFEIKFFGFEKTNDMICTNYTIKEEGIEFEVQYEGETQKYFIPARGKHNIYNAMAGILVGIELELTVDEIRQGILDFMPSKMRLDIIKHNGIVVINDAYNASPDSMKAAIDVLKEYETNRKIAVLGDMLEMGDYAKTGHKNVGEYLCGKSDMILTVGNNSAYIGQGAIEKGFSSANVHHFSSNDEVNQYLDKVVEKEDVILIKGSRGMKMEEIVKHLNK